MIHNLKLTTEESDILENAISSFEVIEDMLLASYSIDILQHDHNN